MGVGGGNRRIEVQAGWEEGERIQDPISKVTKSKND
jgi:hypothetical protein